MKVHASIKGLLTSKKGRKLKSNIDDTRENSCSPAVLVLLRRPLLGFLSTERLPRMNCSFHHRLLNCLTWTGSFGRKPLVREEEYKRLQRLYSALLKKSQSMSLNGKTERKDKKQAYSATKFSVFEDRPRSRPRISRDTFVSRIPVRIQATPSASSGIPSSRISPLRLNKTHTLETPSLLMSPAVILCSAQKPELSSPTPAPRPAIRKKKSGASLKSAPNKNRIRSAPLATRRINSNTVSSSFSTPVSQTKYAGVHKNTCRKGKENGRPDWT
ncbi:uncharacterized protein EV420DRAFT_1604191 [Desarmillaria tabescens]|uniref:Uncharacterized protein n=1 Tax=Armillaria tabescens TaxID=1929756 RepID=A0AA39J0S3_ARMTA|nr:uncharacterized protein EV420DRAFT_1604191 [Desarmillaria tabescens]KAK0432684.1 hypothetical protein EV420DRAFT_1604191 [Desarmillaria tabescens]